MRRLGDVLLRDKSSAAVGEIVEEALRENGEEEAAPRCKQELGYRRSIDKAAPLEEPRRLADSWSLATHRADWPCAIVPSYASRLWIGTKPVGARRAVLHVKY